MSHQETNKTWRKGKIVLNIRKELLDSPYITPDAIPTGFGKRLVWALQELEEQVEDMIKGERHE